MTEREHVPVVVIGAGQAGLSISWHLKQRGIEHVVLERDVIAHEWSDARWDSFCLVTPNWQCRLPGFAYDGDDPDGFMVKPQIVDYLRRYAGSFDPPVREHCEVRLVRASELGGFDVETITGGERVEYVADAVVVATGGYHTPSVPRFAERLPEAILQLPSAGYRRPGQLPDGGVLVVGTGQSGAQIAEDLHLAGRRVHLCVGSAPRVARFYRGRDCVAWLEDMGHYRLTVADHPLGDDVRHRTNHYVTGRDGGRDLDLRRFARDGMRLYGSLTGVDAVAGTTWLRFAPDLRANLDSADAVSEGIKDAIDTYIEARGIQAPTEARYSPVWQPEGDVPSLDLDAAGITSVLWCTGFRPDYRWLRAGVFDGRGLPVHHRGVTDVPGVYFLGLPWQHTWGSGRFSGVGDDAAFLAGQVATRLRRLVRVPVLEPARPVTPLSEWGAAVGPLAG